MSESILWIIAGVTFVLAAFYAGSETALFACDRIRFRHLADKGNKRARMVLDLLDDPEYFLSVVLVGTNLAQIGCTAVFTTICAAHFAEYGDTIATVILVPLILVFDEIIPKGLFLYYADGAALATIYPLRVMSASLYPVIWLFSTATGLLTRLVPGKPRGRKLHITMDDLLFHIGDSGEAGLIAPETTALARRAMELLVLKVRDAMVPLENVVMIPYESTRDEFRNAFKQEGYSRMPVYRGSRENIVGVLSVHELLKHDSSDAIRSSLQPPYTIPTETPVVDVLFHMKERGRHMGLIEDESGRTGGITTMENILEKFVGAIADEFN